VLARGEAGGGARVCSAAKRRSARGARRCSAIGVCVVPGGGGKSGDQETILRSLQYVIIIMLMDTFITVFRLIL
jgi:hypothetical protein